MVKFAALSSLTLGLLILAGCSNVSYVQRESPANPYKDYQSEERASVLGVGEPISKRQMRANATFSARGNLPLKEVMDRLAATYNVAIRWGNGTRPQVRESLLIADLTFDEARSYLEDVYDIQIVREGERRLLVLPAADARRIKNFAPGINVTLSQAVRGLAQQCEMNLVISENKDKLANTKVTTSLRDVTCHDAFRALLAPHGLSLIDEGDFFIIGGLPQRQWLVNLYEPIREEETEISYASEVTGSGDNSSSTNNVGGSGRVSVTESRDLWLELEEDLTGLLRNTCTLVSNASVAGGDGAASSANASGVLPPPSLAGGASQGAAVSEGELVTEGLSSEEEDIPAACGYVRINRSVGMVQMRAPLHVLEQADEIVNHIEDIASRRLLVEARVLAVQRTRGFNQDGGLQLGGEQDDAVLGTTYNDISSIVGAVNGRLRSLASSVDGGAFYAQSSTLDAVVRFVENFGTTYQLMRPTIEVMDRQRAMLIDGTNRKYFLIQTTQETNADGTPGDTTTEVEERSQFVGLQFSVAVQVAEDGDPHTVSVQIPMTEIVENVTIPDGSNSVVPVVSTRLIDQKVRLRDGEIKAIGGLTRTLAVDTEQGVPVVRGLPGAGKLFNEETISYEEVEFVILLQVQRLY